MPFGTRGSHTRPVATYAAAGMPCVSARSCPAAPAAPSPAAIREAMRIGSTAATRIIDWPVRRVVVSTVITVNGLGVSGIRDDPQSTLIRMPEFGEGGTAGGLVLAPAQTADQVFR